MRGRGMAFVIGRQSGKNRAQQNQPGTEPEESQAEQLNKLAKLHDEGTLSDEEFSQAKKKVLSEK